LENIGHACHFAVGAWLSKFCMALAAVWAPSVQKWSLRKRQEVLRIKEEK